MQYLPNAAFQRIHDTQFFAIIGVEPEAVRATTADCIFPVSARFEGGIAGYAQAAAHLMHDAVYVFPLIDVTVINDVELMNHCQMATLTLLKNIFPGVIPEE